MKSFRFSLWMLIVGSCLLFLLASCYHKSSKTPAALAVQYSEEQLDSISFSSTHHYTENYNFVVRADSVCLLVQQPEEWLNGMPTDTFKVKKNDRLVVADIRMIPTDSIDSVWVQVARDQLTFGWIHESDLLPRVNPDDPISQFISFFSDVHLLVFLVVIVLIGSTYLLMKLYKYNARIVHFNDIPSFYPSAFVLMVATSATIYATIQTQAPEMWRHFYFHPTLNPFRLPFLLAIFIASVWAILIIGLAAADEVRRLLPFGEAVLYLCGMVAVASVSYVVFSITTLYTIGYALLMFYYYYAIRHHQFS